MDDNKSKRKQSTSENIDMSYDKNAEEIVLGGVLGLEGAINDVITILTPEMFYMKRNRIVYEAVLALEKDNDPVDIITVSDKLRSLGKLEEAGNYHYQ